MTELLQSALPVAACYRPARVRALFDELAGTYGAAEWLSGGQLGRWRRSLVGALRWPTAGPVAVVDLMAGGAELWAPLHQRLGSRLALTAVDFSASMLARAARRAAPGLTPLQADALATGMPSGAAAAVTCAFGLKTLAPAAYPALAAEAARLLRPGGQLALLEFDLPAQPWVRAAMLTYLRLLPATLRHVCPEAAGHAALPRYACLGVRWPAVLAALREAGFGAVRQQRLWPGCARLVVAEKL
ncbi:demethylmenaquinone methyltransferase [Hymenobacter ginsengisoli]|uniref:Demethylmenaquinone methyltransferase n=1 Tax=Hymenobacter ginsengisoli TaxID=1051626 RepID=A0ABP8QLR9_9BACT|nr:MULTISPECIES: class I SAM-dependent methyltransferase [unclassified Hymenobacter]MBO2031088.1 class I SAM-dependent methyltransferase [Hymenobacter sp. BT559]